MMLRSSISTVASSARSMSSSAAAAKEIQRVAVVGMGSMGHGIVQLSAASGFDVVAVDLSQDAVDKAMSHIEGSLTKMASKNDSVDVEGTMGRIETSTDVSAVADADLVVEAIVENLPIKLDFFKSLGEITKDDAILATNTSSFPVTEMALASGRPSHVCGLHYFNPVQIMKLVEIVATDHTDPAAIDAVSAFVKKTGKVGVPCSDTPGFIVNRLLVPYIVQGVAMVARGDATPQDVDTAMRLGAGHPMGPITLSDYVGNDINLAVMKGWVERYPDDPAFQAPEAMELLEKMCAENKLGRKTGQGFYKWEGNKVVA